MSVASMDGIVYNHDKLKELGLEPPQRYSDLDNPKLAGHVAFPDITHTQHWNAVAGLAYEAGASEADLTKGIAQLNKIKPAYYYSASTDLSTKMASGEIWAAPWHAGFVVRLRRNKVPLSITYPKFGTKRGALWPVLHHIVRGTQNEALAEKFVNTYLDPEVQLAHASGTGVLPTNRAALKKLGEDAENKSVLLLEGRGARQSLRRRLHQGEAARMARGLEPGRAARLIGTHRRRCPASRWNVWSSATA